MKELLFVFCFLTAVKNANAQDPVKEKTVEYIETLYKNAFKYGRIKVTSVQCEDSFLIKTFSDNDTARTNLSNVKKLQLERHYDGTKWHITYLDIAGKEKKEYVLGHIELESDALKLKDALERLIVLVTKERRSPDSKIK